MLTPTSNLPSNFISTLRKLDYNIVLEWIARLCTSESGKQQALKLIPKTDRFDIELELKKVSEVKELLISENNIPLESFKNIIPALKKTTVKNQVLTAVELLDIASLIRISRAIKSFLYKQANQFPAIAQLHHTLFSDKIIEHHIVSAIDDRGVVKDSASRELREIRHAIVAASDSLRKKLESILRHISQKEFLQEDIITTRDGRFVIPVKTEFKNQVPGFIHSTSSSGATVFIEPAESLDLNNALRELQLREQREIHKILSDLTNQVATIRESLEVSFNTLTEIDVIFARAKYSIEILGNAPIITDKPIIKLIDARHPVLLQHLKRGAVVPISIEIGKDYNTIIITGPNAGGKTVAMKTVGLLTCLAQAGIHIPASQDSEIYPFQNIFVDIGDEQSIENDLSSFSSHLISLRTIIENANENSLVLIDEIGTGTDPSEGGALGAVVLKELTNLKAVTIATTHHGMLKAFAHETSGISNASMEFDQESLIPTYHFRCGIPGSSYAFELAERLGIQNKLIEQARKLVGDEKIKLESLLIELEKQSQEYKKQLNETRSEKKKLEDIVLSYEQKTIQLTRELGTIKKKALEEAKQLVQQTRAKVEQSIKEIRESQADKSVIKSSKQVLKQLGEELHKLYGGEEVESESEDIINKGDFVRVRNGNEQGEVEEIQGKYAIVLCGNAKLRIATKNLFKIRKLQSTSIHSNDVTTTIQAKNEIDLRGLFGDEAIEQVQTFLDNAFAAGLHRVDIIHGKGTGALRKRIIEFVKEYPHTKSFRLGEWNEGGTGVTIVELA